MLDEVIQVNAQLHRQRDAGIKHAQGIIAHIVTQVHTRIGIAPIHLATRRRKGLHTLDGSRKIQFQ